MLTPKGHPDIAGCGILNTAQGAKQSTSSATTSIQTDDGTNRLMKKAVQASMASEGSMTREKIKRYVENNY